MSKPKLSKNNDEVCYPFIYEHSLKCDYEILTDEMCRQVGGLIAEMPEAFSGLQVELETLQPMIYHLNGSIRGSVRFRRLILYGCVTAMCGIRRRLPSACRALFCREARRRSHSSMRRAQMRKKRFA